MLFKVKGYRGVFDEKHEQMVDHHSCRLGKWVEGEGRKLFGKTSAFSRLEKPHAIVHQSVNDALRCVEEGTCLSDIEYVKSRFEAAEKASKELFGIMEQMLQEKESSERGES
ncbi:CZB domain-containing protein [Hydrogenimonas sp.]